jgi:hypothetical protein
MTDGADDGNRTIIVRPTPGRRQPSAAPTPSPTPQEPRREVPPAAPIAPVTDSNASPEEALTIAAAPETEQLPLKTHFKMESFATDECIVAMKLKTETNGKDDISDGFVFLA